MAKISLIRPHTMGVARARQIVDQVAAELATKHQVKSAWQGNTLDLSRSGLKGSLAVTDTEVNIRVELGLLLSAFKPIIEREITEQLNAKLA